MRLTKLRQRLHDEGLDAILITQAANRRYVSGFSGSAGTLLISQTRALLATDFRYFEQVGRQVPDFELVKVTEKLVDLLPDLVSELDARRIGFESEDLTFALYSQFAEALPEVELAPTTDLVEGIRAVKDKGELEKLRRAIALTDAAYTHIAGWMQPGMTERQVAWELEKVVRDHGADKMAFVTVASGPNGAMPHYATGERVIQAGEPIVMDFGALIDGYHADLTRTVALGEPNGRYRQVYDIVLQAQQAALAGIRPGMTGKQADALARDVIAAAGYGEFFGHSLGHGLGLVVHERPWVSHLRRGEEQMLQAGMVFTIEPGIYLPGEFGVRIEDVGVLRDDGLEVLSGAAKQPVLAADGET
jgi:Xaa-Pro aminopeptidase